MIEDVASSPTVTGGAQYAVGGNGALVYVPTHTVSSDAPILWMDRLGKTTALRAMPANWSNPMFSPDGSRLAVDISDGRQSDVWIYDWARDVLSRLTFDPNDDVRPVWTPDGRRIVFSSKRGNSARFNLYWQRADGTGEATRLTESDNDQWAGSWNPAGTVFAFTETTPPPTLNGIMLLPMQGDEASGWMPGKPGVFLNTPVNEANPNFSPDGRWIAYLSNEGGRNDVYVRPFPGPGGRWQISTSASDDPIWSRTGRELFFAASPGLRLMVARYSVEGDSFRAERPTPVSEIRFAVLPRTPSRDIALHPDGQRFAMAPAPETESAPLDKVTFVFNFFDELRRIAEAPK